MRYKARQFIGIIADAGRIDDFDIDLYCAFVEKTTVLDRSKIIVSLIVERTWNVKLNSIKN